MPYKNSEKRKEKSRDAARCRRSKETEVFFELANSLPLPASMTAQLDKASVMRVAISFLKISSVLEQHNWTDSDVVKSKTDAKLRVDQLYPKALDGFVFILSKEGDIVYINDSVAKYLGIPQIELVGQSIYDFAHPCDHDEIREVLSIRAHGPKVPVTEERVFFVRLKCTLTSKGRNVNLKSATYKVMKCTGRLVMKNKKQSPNHSIGNLLLFPYLLSVAEPIPHPANIETPMDGNTFLSKHDMNMHFTYCDERVQDLINYSSEDLLGKSLYDYHHALDSETVEKAFKDLFAKGQTMTGQYRFLAQGGGMAWVITQATVIYNNRSQKAQWVVCVHHVLSHVEQKELVLSEVQLSSTKCLPLSMQMSTETIFARKTDDMDKGYFTPPEISDTITITDNEPENLLYLAPTAGEECVPLGFPTFSQVAARIKRYDDRGLSSPPALLIVGLKQERDVSSPLNRSRDLLNNSHSPGLKQEPDILPSLCRSRDIPSTTQSPASTSSASSRISSPHDYLMAASNDMLMSMDKFFQAMDTKTDGSSDQDVEAIDFDSRAPYIPMSGDEDYSLLPPSTESLLTLQNDVNPGLFGKTECVFTSKSELFDEFPQPPKRSIRDMICGSTTVASIEQPPSTLLQQIKRPLDMNSLETGPPANKIIRLVQGQSQCSPPVSTKDSVLLNLLLTGEDRNHGYRVNSSLTTNSGSHKEKTHNSLLRSQLLPNLTQRDCEVNAPVQSNRLLQGADLLHALEIGCPRIEPAPR